MAPVRDIVIDIDYMGDMVLFSHGRGGVSYAVQVCDGISGTIRTSFYLYLSPFACISFSLTQSRLHAVVCVCCGAHESHPGLPYDRAAV